MRLAQGNQSLPRYYLNYLDFLPISLRLTSALSIESHLLHWKTQGGIRHFAEVFFRVSLAAEQRIKELEQQLEVMSQNSGWQRIP